MTDSRHISFDDLALHAMNALSPEESAAARLHLAGCAECRDQLAEIAGDLALVAISTEQQEIPSGARQRFIDRIAAAPRSDAATPPPQSSPVISISREKKASRSLGWIPWVAAAALLILCVNLYVRVRILNDQVAMAEAQLANNERSMKARIAQNTRAWMLLDALTAPAAQRITLTAGKTPPAPSARAVYLARRGALVLQASNMPPLSANKTYELWIIPMKGAPMPAGMFRPDASGSGSVVLPAIPTGVQAKAFGITVENEGGADTPTMPIVLSGAAPAAGE
jgi:anti-sigma-K factor RskA